MGCHPGHLLVADHAGVAAAVAIPLRGIAQKRNGQVAPVPHGVTFAHRVSAACASVIRLSGQLPGRELSAVYTGSH